MDDEPEGCRLFLKKSLSGHATKTFRPGGSIQVSRDVEQPVDPRDVRVPFVRSVPPGVVWEWIALNSHR